jgi:hypothetical protein
MLNCHQFSELLRQVAEELEDVSSVDDVQDFDGWMDLARESLEYIADDTGIT